MVKDKKQERETFEESEILIKLRHPEEILRKFEKAKTYSQQINLIWKEIADKMNLEFNAEKFEGKHIKGKFNIMNSKYKKQNDMVNKSGTGSATWQYYIIFHETYPKNQKPRMENILYLGYCDEVVLNPTESSNIENQERVYDRPEYKKTCLKDIKIEKYILKIEALKKYIGEPPKDISIEKSKEINKNTKKIKHLSKNIN